MPVTQTRLHELVHYDPSTGIFRWKKSRGGKARADSIAGTAHERGYTSITIDCKPYLAHRLAWLYVHGHLPKEVDHKNRDRSDNRIENLREATRSQNNANARASTRSATKLRGVHFHSGAGRYRAQVTKNRKTKSLGYFDTPEEAHAAYIAAAKVVHGEFARP